MLRATSRQLLFILVYPIFHIALIFISIRMLLSTGFNPSSLVHATRTQMLLTEVGYYLSPILIWPCFILEGFGFQHDSLVLGGRNIGDYVAFYACGIIYAIIGIALFNIYKKIFK